MALEQIIFPSGEKCSKIIEWKVKHGSLISKGRVLLHYMVDSGGGTSEIQKLKASKVGTVTTVLAQEGSTVKPGDVLLEMESCSHPTVMRDLCAECGADLSNEKQNANVPMVHSVPELKVSLEQAQKLGKADEERLLSHRKLVLLVDLDQTLIHTTNDDIPPNLKDVHHFQLYGGGSPWYHTRLRPLTLKFLHNVSSLYELHICTFGARSYAHTIAKILDPDEKLFSHRILSRDECFDPNSKTANLKALFPCGDHMVCIIDDREDVWNFAPNLIAVKPYHFFQHTGDIHAPPGLDKHEQDGSGYTQPVCGEVGDSKSSSSATDEEAAKITNPSPEGSNVILKDEEKTKSEIGDKNKEIKTHETGEKTSKIEEKEPKSEIEETKMDTIKAEEVESEKETEKKTDFNETLKPTAGTSEEKEELEIDGEEKKEISESKMVIELNVVNNEEDKTKMSETKEILEKNESKVESKEDKTLPTENKNAVATDASEIMIDIQDPDDYLLYLQEILERIHTAYYNKHNEEGIVPNMREVVPDVKRKILANQCIVFSGVVPTHVPLASSRSAQTARSLGARVTEQIVPGETTHLVAARPGTAKVNEARRAGTGIHLVSPEWLSCTAERWERAEERLFPLSRTSKRGISEHGSRLSSNSLVESLNPLLALSSEDLKSMDQEVEDIFNETDDESAMDRDADSEEEEDENEDKGDKLDVLDLVADLKTDDATDEDVDINNKTSKRTHELMELGDVEDEEPSMKLFKDPDYTETPTSDAEEDLIDSGDESELSKMGLALEREFLAD